METARHRTPLIVVDGDLIAVRYRDEIMAAITVPFSQRHGPYKILLIHKRWAHFKERSFISCRAAHAVTVPTHQSALCIPYLAIPPIYTLSGRGWTLKKKKYSSEAALYSRHQFPVSQAESARYKPMLCCRVRNKIKHNLWRKHSYSPVTANQINHHQMFTRNDISRNMPFLLQIPY